MLRTFLSLLALAALADEGASFVFNVRDPTSFKFGVGSQTWHSLQCPGSTLTSLRKRIGQVPARMLFENFFQKDKGKEESGKFQRHSKLDGISGAFGPVGVVCCGFGEDELEILAETVELVTRETAWEQPHVPIAVLGKEDFFSKTKLKDVLGKVAERDSVLPDQPADVSVPLVLFSGFPPRQVSAAVTAVRASGIRGGEVGSQVQPLFAIAVPKAMDKTVVQLVEELEGDAMANDPATPPSE